MRSPVNYIDRVQVFESQHQLSGIKSGFYFAQITVFLYQTEQIAADSERHYDVHVTLVRRVILQVRNERMADGGQKIYLVQYVFQMIFTRNLFSFHHLFHALVCVSRTQKRS